MKTSWKVMKTWWNSCEIHMKSPDISVTETVPLPVDLGVKWINYVDNTMLNNAIVQQCTAGQLYGVLDDLELICLYG